METPETILYKLRYFLRMAKATDNFKRELERCNFYGTTIEEVVARAYAKRIPCYNILRVSFNWDTSESGCDYWENISIAFDAVYDYLPSNDDEIIKELI